jgi:fermentation-respiration switch protein FrsA (DUF1100 family)
MGIVKTLLAAAVIAYAAIALLLWILQERLIFLPIGVRGPATAPPGWLAEPVAFRAADGTALAGIFLRPPGNATLPLVVYYGGNAEEITASAHEAAQAYGERAVLLVNYRGYGLSGGRPGEKALVADALALFDWAVSQPRIDRTRVVLHGRSLGSAVAVAVAAARPVNAVILTSPFASAREVASELYPWLPIRWMLRHPFDSAAPAPTIRVPLLMLTGTADTIIAPHHSERLAAAWGGPVERQAFERFGHNDLDLHPGYGAAIRAFLDRTA